MSSSTVYIKMARRCGNKKSDYEKHVAKLQYLLQRYLRLLADALSRVKGSLAFLGVFVHYYRSALEGRWWITGL